VDAAQDIYMVIASGEPDALLQSQEEYVAPVVQK
jgi:hypothetical protein